MPLTPSERAALDEAAARAGSSAHDLHIVLAVAGSTGSIPEDMLTMIRQASADVTNAYDLLIKAGAAEPCRKEAPRTNPLADLQRASQAAPAASALSAHLEQGLPLAREYDRLRGHDWEDTIVQLVAKLRLDAVGPSGSGLE